MKTKKFKQKHSNKRYYTRKAQSEKGKGKNLLMFYLLNHSNTDKSWRPLLKECLNQMDPTYLKKLSEDPHWLPGQTQIFNAFSQPLEKTRRILLGESPYPRKQSANGYAFWDNAVGDIFREFHTLTDFKLSKEVNRATSLRNFLKMLLKVELARESSSLTLVKTLPELFQNFLREGFLLLNASLVFHNKDSVKSDAIAWQPFIFHLLDILYRLDPSIEIILLGKIAKLIDPYLIKHQLNFKKLIAEHPYNLSFIRNPRVLEYFRNLEIFCLK